MKNFYLLALCLLCMAGSAMAQDASKTTPSWTLITEEQGVKVWTLADKCGTDNVLYLKVENSSTESVKVSYVITNNGGMKFLSPSPDDLILKPSEMQQGACNSLAHPTLKVILVGEKKPEFKFSFEVQPQN